MAIDRTAYNALVDDSGTGTDGSVWDKAAIKDVLLDPIDAMWSSITPDLVFNANGAVRRNTTAGSDTGYLKVAGGGAPGASRGGTIFVAGNQSAWTGKVQVEIGNVAGAKLEVTRSDGQPALTVDGPTGVTTFTYDAHVAANLVFPSGGAIQLNTGSGADNRRVLIAAMGSGVTTDRGAIVSVCGNQFSPYPGTVRADLGTIAGAEFSVNYGGVQRFIVKGDTDNAIFAPPFYNGTSGAAANLVVGADGRVLRSTSSRRYKTDIAPLTDWSFLLALQPVTFAARDTGARHMGLIAEDVAAIEPRLAVINPRGEADEVAYPHLTAPLVAAIQSLHARLAALERTPQYGAQ